MGINWGIVRSGTVDELVVWMYDQDADGAPTIADLREVLEFEEANRNRVTATAAILDAIEKLETLPEAPTPTAGSASVGGFTARHRIVTSLEDGGSFIDVGQTVPTDVLPDDPQVWVSNGIVEEVV